MKVLLADFSKAWHTFASLTRWITLSATLQPHCCLSEHAYVKVTAG